ncbi:MAG: hypothetical protein ACJ74L_03175 [Gaiellaceae bacterium]
MFLVLALLLALLLPAPASASHAGDLWATINICDTDAHPNVLGVRASMPGNGTRQTMWMRFRADYYDRATETWRRIPGDSQSRWINTGGARPRARQDGREFTIEPPLPTTTYIVRGIVKFQWRRRQTGEVVRREKQVTRAGHRTGRFGDPFDYSEGICEIRSP